MIRAKLCFVADGVSLDHETSRASAFLIQESLRPPSYPAPMGNLTYFCLFERDEVDPSFVRGEWTISLGAQEIARVNVDVDFMQHRRNHMTLRVEGLVIPGPGDVAFSLALPGHDTASYVVRAEPPSAPSTVGYQSPSYATTGQAKGIEAPRPTVTITTGEVRVR
jgi:hypothetical protein